MVTLRAREASLLAEELLPAALNLQKPEALLANMEAALHFHRRPLRHLLIHSRSHLERA